MIPRIAICLTSHDRIDCTLINEEIFKLNFTHPYIVIHAASGARAVPYLEDAFVRCEPKPHFAGAITLMQTAIKAALPFDPDFLILLDGDTWLLDEQILIGLIQRLQANPLLLMAATSWMPLRGSLWKRFKRELSEIRHIPGDRMRRLVFVQGRMTYDAKDFSTQFFIMRNHKPLLDVFLSLRIDDKRLIERQWFDRFSTRFSLRRVLRIREREPVHPDNRLVCERLGLYSQHWPAAGTSADQKDKNSPYYVRPGMPGKREALERYPHIRKGKNIRRLLNAVSLADLDYYNAGAKRW